MILPSRIGAGSIRLLTEGGGWSAQSLLEGFNDASGQRFNHSVPADWISQTSFEVSFQLADLKDADPPSWSSEASPELQGVATKVQRQAFIDSAWVASQARNQPGAVPVGAIGIEVDFKGVATRIVVAASDGPVRAWVIFITDGQHIWVVPTDVEGSFLPLANHRIADLSVPEQFVAHSWIHGPGTAAVNRGSRSAGSLDGLGVCMTRKHQDPYILVFASTADPRRFERDLRSGEKILIRLARCVRC